MEIISMLVMFKENESALMLRIALRIKTSASPIKYPMNKPMIAILKERKLNFLKKVSNPINRRLKENPPISP